jgi:hypothetical protein
VNSPDFRREWRTPRPPNLASSTRLRRFCETD